MAHQQTIQFYRGNKASLPTSGLTAFEPVLASDSRELFIATGATTTEPIRIDLSLMTELAATPASGDWMYVFDISEAGVIKGKKVLYSNVAAGSGATTALDNLASVQINTSLLSDTPDTDSLGSTGAEWLNLYIGDAGSIFLGLSQDASISRTAANQMTITATGGVIISDALGLTGDRVTKGWFTDLESTNDITIGGTALASIYSTAELDNLGTVAINTSLISDTDVTDDLGTGDVRWNDTWFETISSGLTAADTLKLRARDVDGAAYVDILTITSNNTVTADLNALTTIGGNAILSDVSTVSALTTTGTITTGGLGSGGVLAAVTMTLGSDADGDIYFRSSNVLTRLAKGSAFEILQINSGATAPEWVIIDGGTF